MHEQDQVYCLITLPFGLQQPSYAKQLGNTMHTTKYAQVQNVVKVQLVNSNTHIPASGVYQLKS